MGAKKKTEKKEDLSILTYEEYCSTLKLAELIRNENEDLIKKATTPKEKTQLLETLFHKYKVPAHSSSTKEREQTILIKVNIFIPDNEQFALDYKGKFDKNIRLISEAYQIPAPFAISKVAELGKYEQYQKQLKKEGGLASKTSSVAFKENKEVLKKIPEPEVPKLEKKEVPKTKDFEQYIQSMGEYWAKLATSNEQLQAENKVLKSQLQQLQSLFQALQKENQELKERPQIPTTETEFHQKIKSLEFMNEELKKSLEAKDNLVTSYRNRAVIAEAQLDQLHDQMAGLARDVDSIELFPYTTFEHSKELSS